MELRSDNFEELRSSRQWRTSTIGPFAGNIVFVFRECYDERYVFLDSCNYEDYVEVLLYVNEVVTAVPGCGDDGHGCTLRELKEVFSSTCDFSAVCSMEEGEEGVSDGEVTDDRY